MEHRLGSCGACGARYQIPASFPHPRARCRRCGGAVDIGPVIGARPERAESPRAEPRAEPVRAETQPEPSALAAPPAAPVEVAAAARGAPSAEPPRAEPRAAPEPRTEAEAPPLDATARGEAAQVSRPDRAPRRGARERRPSAAPAPRRNRAALVLGAVGAVAVATVAVLYFTRRPTAPDGRAAEDAPHETSKPADAPAGAGQ